MKRKNYIISLASALLMGTMALSLTACSSEDNIVNSAQQPAQGEVRTYTVSLPATFSDNAGTRAVAFDNSGTTPAIVTKFVENEKVYVYNKTTSALLEGYLTVKNVSADMKSCELQGQLTGTGTISADDEVELLYNLNYINSTVSSVDDFYYDYSTQNGTAASCVDGAKATMKVKAIDASNNYKTTFYAVGDETAKTQAKAVFANLQSMFRFSFTDGTNPIKVKTLNIQSRNVAIANRFYPMLSSQYYPSSIYVTPSDATADYLYVGLCINEANAADDVLYFCVTDDNGNAYIGTKAAPAGGFENGKYYYSTSPIALEKPSAPTITWTNPSSPVAADASLIYDFTAVTDFDITIANADGKDFCSGYAFRIASSGAKGTIRLNNLNARWNSGNPSTPFISGGSDFVVELTGTNSITTNVTNCIKSGGNLKLSCTGASATLKVTSKAAYYCGIVGVSNYHSTSSNPGYNDYLTTTELDVTSQLAAPGYTVTRSARTDNADGTYTWTYTVAPSTDLATPLTLEALAGGSISVDPEFPISYSVNGGALVEISADTEINVTAGQKVSFYSTNSALAKEENSVIGYTNINPHIQCYVYGNVMSLIDDSGNGFANDKEISAMALCGLFQSAGAANLINHPTKPILLPATTLASKCYQLMFMGCSSLTTAPDLPAPTLAESCYEGMFMNCTSLNSVKCLATIVSAYKCLDNWLFGVSATGTLVKASGADWAKAGTNGIPAGWTVTSE